MAFIFRSCLLLECHKDVHSRPLEMLSERKKEKQKGRYLLKMLLVQELLRRVLYVTAIGFLLLRYIPSSSAVLLVVFSNDIFYLFSGYCASNSFAENKRLFYQPTNFISFQFKFRMRKNAGSCKYLYYQRWCLSHWHNSRITNRDSRFVEEKHQRIIQRHSSRHLYN